MNFRPDALRFMDSLERMPARPGIRSAYADRIEKYLAYLNSGTIDDGVQLILGSLSKCIDAVRRSTDDRLLVHKREMANPNYFLAALNRAIDSTIKERKYSRLEAPLALSPDADLTTELAGIALELPYDETVNFIGELTGAWILTYPIVSILQYDRDMSPADWAHDEIDYIYVLRRRFDVEFDEWSR